MTYLACISVITIGIYCYVSLSSVCDRLVTAKDAFYTEYNFADAFARVNLAPEGVTESLEKLDGIKAAQGRLSVSARVVTDDKDKIVTLRVYGLDTQTQGQINEFKILGQPLQDPKDIIVGQPFLESHNLSDGDTLELSVYGNRAQFTVRGAFNSPEHVYVMPDSGAFLPDPYTFGIAAVTKETLENLSGRKGAVTDIALLLEDGYTFGDIKGVLGETLEKYGIIYLLNRKDQPSNQMLTMELDSIGGMSTAMSGLFLLVAAAILYIMLRRLVEQERTQIGVLKAFGYPAPVIIGNYMLYGAVSGLIGGILGASLGIAGADAQYNLYMKYFSIPSVEMDITSGAAAYFIKGVLVSTGAGMLAAYLGVWGALKLRPAEAMRPSAPPLIKKSLFNNNRFFDACFTKRGMMSLRYIERNKLKSALIIFSVSLSYMLMAFMFSYNFLMDKMMYAQLTKVETYDMKVTLKTPVAKSAAISGINGVKGVKYAEAVLEIPFTISFNNISKTGSITGLNNNSPIYKIMDNNDVYYSPPDDGVLMTKITADALGAGKGDIITLDSPYLNEKKSLRVTDVFDSSFSSGGYMEAAALSRLLELPPVSNVIAMSVEPGMGGDIKETLINASNISDISDKEAILKSYHDMMDPQVGLIYVVLALAVLVAFAVIYNVSGVSLSERQRELATMRVLGYAPHETSEILAFENYFLCFFAVLVGIPLTMGLVKVYGVMFNSDLFSMPETIPAISYVYAALACILAVFLSNAAVLYSVKKFELAVVLKERE